MNRWSEMLKYDALRPLMSSGVEPVAYFARRDLLDEDVGPASFLWATPAARRIVRRQRHDGSWSHSGHPHPVFPKRHHDLVETWRVLSQLTGCYEFTRGNPSARAAAEFVLSFQTEKGDIRGFLANQYATYYTGAVLATLIRAGYGDDPRVAKGLEWLLSMRQEDGGWSIPILTRPFDRRTMLRLTSRYARPIEPDRSKPSSHNWTDMALRAFAAHPRYRMSAEPRAAADLLKASFFKPDYYSSMRAVSHWVRFLFWWPNLLTALESLSLMGYSGDDPDVRKALDWFAGAQEPSGLWKTTYERGREEGTDERTKERKLWLTLRICRTFRAFCQ